MLKSSEEDLILILYVKLSLNDKNQNKICICHHRQNFSYVVKKMILISTTDGF